MRIRTWFLCTIFICFSAQECLAVPTSGSRIMVSAPSPYAILAAQDIIQAGGNVADVAVAVSLTLAVTSPYFGSLGGGGFAMIKMSDQVEVLDFRETAPLITNKDYYLDKPANASTQGGSAVAVPGIPAGLSALHKKYGKLSWARLFQVPFSLASNGFNVSGEWVENTNRAKEAFNPSGLKYFFKEGKTSLKPGELLKQAALLRALKDFRSKNQSGFYAGQVAQDLVRSVKAAGGVLSLEDLSKYKVRWLKPMITEFAGHKLYLMPPPSSGGVVMKTAFALVERMKLPAQKAFSVNEFHLLGEILSRSFRGRTELGDPDFNKNPISHLLSPAYFDELAKSIKLSKATEISGLKGIPAESTETTHFSIVDSAGNAIALTETLNGNYGSGVVSERFGIALNNEMDDFTTRLGQGNLYGLVQGKGNQVEPGKRPLSSMSPTLVEKDGKVIMAIGAPGGPRIISSVFQAIYRSLVNGLDIDRAIQSPRVHHQFDPNILYVDRDRLSPETIDGLIAKGHKVETSWMGKVYAVKLNDDGTLSAAFDSRGEGAAGGF